MTNTDLPFPLRCAQLVMQPVGAGRFAVKNPQTGEFFEIGEEERFLLDQFDGTRNAADILATHANRYADPLSPAELHEFVNAAWENGLLESDSPTPRRSRNNILHWRLSVFNPDKLFRWLEPKLAIFWTRGFFLLSTASILWATMALWMGRAQLDTSFHHAWRWETVLLAWATTFVVGLAHECAHGLTCKRYGGEVREIGFLLICFIPCFYCNVSDAWLFREKSKRIWVTLAGAYLELFLWSLAVLVWSISVPDTLINYLAFVIITVTGVDTLFNFNPLIKLDGYYLLADWLEVPNLMQRSSDLVMGHLRRFFWGGPTPEHHAQSRFLYVFGLTCWLYTLVFLSLMLIWMHGWLNTRLGCLGLPVVVMLGFVSSRRFVKALFREEFFNMIWYRHRRTVCWAALFAATAAVTIVLPWADRAGGSFAVRSLTRAEIRATTAGFLGQVCGDEGDSVKEGDVVAQLHVPDLESRLAQKAAELSEAEARLRLLFLGTRAEEMEQQQRRVEAAQAWRDVAVRNLLQQRECLRQELVRYDHLVAECRAESEYARETLSRLERLRETNAVSVDEFAVGRKTSLVAEARCDQVEAQRKSRAAAGTLAAQGELAEREREFTNEQATLALMRAGSRPEEIEASQATVSRIQQERAYLQQLSKRTVIRCPVDGVITTRRLREKVGQYLREGELLCEVEDGRRLEIVITVDEDQAVRVRPGQPVRLKARALPFQVLEAEVERVAPRAVTGDVRSRVNVYCRLQDPDGQLRSGMTGYARIECGRGCLARVATQKLLRLLRTEFWW